MLRLGRKWSQSKFAKFKVGLPDKFKGGRIEKWGNYWKIVGRDYKEALKDIGRDSKEAPLKAFAYVSALAGIGYAIMHNPDENDVRDALQCHMNDSALLGDKIRNPEVDDHFNYLVDCLSHDLVRRVSLGFFSLLWIDNYSKACALYKARCSYLKPSYLTFYERIIDVGFLNVWWVLTWKLREFDINPDEWNADDSRRQLSAENTEKAS